MNKRVNYYLEWVYNGYYSQENALRLLHYVTTPQCLKEKFLKVWVSV